MEEVPSLNDCVICKEREAIYCCPACSVKTCSLTCCRIHKEKSGCNGKRNRVGFVPLHTYSDSTLSSDFHFLEDVLAKSQRGKRLMKDIGAAPEQKSRYNRRQKLKTDNVCDGENDEKVNGEESVPIQPLLRLKVEEEKGSSTKIKDMSLNIDVVTDEKILEEGTDSSSKNPSILSQKEKICTVVQPLSQEEERHITQQPLHKQNLIRQAKHRGINLLLMPPGMQRHILNKSTKYDTKKDLIYWKAEFILHNFPSNKSDNISESNKANPSKITLTAERIPETEPVLKHLSKLLRNNTSHSAESITRSTLIKFCNSSAPDQLKSDVSTLMKRIPCNASQPSYRRIDINNCLKDILRGASVIEFPTFEIVLDKDLSRFPVFIDLL